MVQIHLIFLHDLYILHLLLRVILVVYLSWKHCLLDYAGLNCREAKLWMCSCMNGEQGHAHQFVIFGSPCLDPHVTLALPFFDPFLFLAWVRVTIIWVILWNLDWGWKWYPTPPKVKLWDCCNCRVYKLFTSICDVHTAVGVACSNDKVWVVHQVICILY